MEQVFLGSFLQWKQSGHEHHTGRKCNDCANAAAQPQLWGWTWAGPKCSHNGRWQMHPVLCSTLDDVLACHMDGPLYFVHLPAVSPDPAVVSLGWKQSFGTRGGLLLRHIGWAHQLNWFRLPVGWPGIPSGTTGQLRHCSDVTSVCQGHSKVCICQIALRAVMKRVKKWASPLPNLCGHKSCR